MFTSISYHRVNYFQLRVFFFLSLFIIFLLHLISPQSTHPKNGCFHFEAGKGSHKLVLLPETQEEKIQGSVDYIFPNSWVIDSSWAKAFSIFSLAFASPNGDIFLWQLQACLSFWVLTPLLSQSDQERERRSRDRTPHLVSYWVKGPHTLGFTLHAAFYTNCSGGPTWKAHVLKWTLRTEILKFVSQISVLKMLLLSFCGCLRPPVMPPRASVLKDNFYWF